MDTKYMRTFEDYDEAVQDDGAKQPEPVKDKITDPGWILNYIESGKPFCILSAYRPGDSPEVNQRNHDALEKETLKNKYAYHAMAFRCQSAEGAQMVKQEYRSLFVPEMPVHVGLYLAKKYGQPMVAVRSDEGLDFISVEDGSLLLSINVDGLKTAWSTFIFAPGAFLRK